MNPASVADSQSPDVMASWISTVAFDKSPAIPIADSFALPSTSYMMAIQSKHHEPALPFPGQHILPPRPTSPSTTPPMQSTPHHQPPGDDEPTSDVETQPKEKPKEKKHACWMCHKAFDRPSTLKKHLLVHTGEKAHACSICSRRFGVLSNLNRHMKRCAQKPVNAAKSLSGSNSGSNSPSEPPTPSSSKLPPAQLQVPPRGRKRKASPNPSSPPPTPEIGEAQRRISNSPPADQKPKRRRRAPSPSLWIPESLRDFNLAFYPKTASMPLPPVVSYGTPDTGSMWEERNSYDNEDEDENCNFYHPRGWKGTLPGPGLLGRDVLNTKGKLLVF
ncbi:hypothetical protein JAAARDRAFT_183631 [Jaapia argillacea MUCL 33604]|uniref:pH-response transcription factor pacC/RIM101 n=1 Tax=Jaapia argillacea MUCL 33604 TaxID=933084 RepID=A0A067PRN1_9AGAM|nr:hypothetical protein JAAARDRAFT_183631 [Jaapia argillacea MUCL 33604]